jgi:hypothetical protein
VPSASKACRHPMLQEGHRPAAPSGRQTNALRSATAGPSRAPEQRDSRTDEHPATDDHHHDDHHREPCAAHQVASLPRSPDVIKTVTRHASGSAKAWGEAPCRRQRPEALRSCSGTWGMSSSAVLLRPSRRSLGKVRLTVTMSPSVPAMRSKVRAWVRCHLRADGLHARQLGCRPSSSASAHHRSGRTATPRLQPGAGRRC